MSNFSKKIKFCAYVFSLVVYLSCSYIISFAFEGGFVFSHIMKLGDTSMDVLLLQQVLNKDPDTVVAMNGVGSIGFETDYFGQKTKDAVIRFQNKYKEEILFPLGLDQGTGFVGSKTLLKLNQLLTSFQTKDGVAGLEIKEGVKEESDSQSTILIPSINNLPDFVEEGQKVVLKGTNLVAPKSIKIINEIESSIKDISFSDNSISFVFSTPISKAVKDELVSLSGKDDEKKVVFEAMSRAFKSEDEKQFEMKSTIIIMFNGFPSIRKEVFIVFKY